MPSLVSWQWRCLLQDVDAIREAPAEGVYVHGLFLDGCAWSAKENRLVDAEPKKLFHPLPVLLVTAVLVRTTLTARVANIHLFNGRTARRQHAAIKHLLADDCIFELCHNLCSHPQPH